MNRVTHLDYLADKLREDRVRRVIEPMLSGTHTHAFTDRDIGYARDLGLLARDAPLRVANPIYAEVLPRELAWVAQETLDLPPPRYLKADGSLDAELLMAEFQDFFRRHSEHWRNRFAYEEAWPQLLLQAYLQRVVNGGGPHRAGVRSGERAGRPADRVAAGGPGAGVRGGVQGGARARRARARGGRGRGADGALRGPLRGGGRAPGGDRPAREPELGGEDLPHAAPLGAPATRRRRRAGRGVWGM